MASKATTAEYTGTTVKFIEAMGTGAKIYMKRPRGKTTVYFNWVNGDRWFCNVEYKSSTSRESSWIIAKDLPGFIDYLTGTEKMQKYIG